MECMYGAVGQMQCIFQKHSCDKIITIGVFKEIFSVIKG